MKSDSMKEAINRLQASLAKVVQNTHASIAIVGASVIDERLREVLLSRMRPLSKTLEGRLFEGYGPLSSFSSRIDLSFALGLVSSEIRDDMNTMRKIRNRFAHSRELLHFNDPEIAERCKKLGTWDVGKTDLEAVYVDSLGAINRYLGEVARKGQPKQDIA